MVKKIKNLKKSELVTILESLYDYSVTKGDMDSVGVELVSLFRTYNIISEDEYDEIIS